jgi:hypothetical protein
MPLLPLFGITGNVLLACIAVIAITYSPYFAYISGAVAGILMEIMLSPFNFLNLVIYPVLALLGAYAFADKNERRLERERSVGKKGENISPYLRIPACTAMMVFVKEAVNRVYVYLSGEPITFFHFSRALAAVFYAMLLSSIIMLPMRRLLGIRLRRASKQ